MSSKRNRGEHPARWDMTHGPVCKGVPVEQAMLLLVVLYIAHSKPAWHVAHVWLRHLMTLYLAVQGGKWPVAQYVRQTVRRLGLGGWGILPPDWYVSVPNVRVISAGGVTQNVTRSRIVKMAVDHAKVEKVIVYRKFVDGSGIVRATACWPTWEFGEEVFVRKLY